MYVDVQKILNKLLSLDQWELNKELSVRNYIKSLIPEIEEDNIGNLYLSNPGCPLLSAHMDGVHSFDDNNIITEKEGIIKSLNLMGLNADDRCGIAIAIATYLEDPSSCGLLFTIEEETGMQGARHFVEYNTEFLKEHTYCIVLDRKGSGDIIGASNNYCSQTFETWFANVSARYGYKPNVGVASDADEFNTEINCVNVSIGYYNAHTKTEYINIAEFVNAYRMVQYIITQPISKAKLKVEVPTYSWKRNRYDLFEYDTAPTPKEKTAGNIEYFDEEYFDEEYFGEESFGKESPTVGLCPNCMNEITAEDKEYGSCAYCEFILV